MKKSLERYKGFEIGPIRPPSEAYSLLIRVTRNCPWNQCRFCGLYKGKKFSIRPKEDVFRDIDLIEKCINIIREFDNVNRNNKKAVLYKLKKSLGDDEYKAYYSAISWYRSGMKSIFLQDANSMIIDPDYMVEILTYIRSKFPQVERITSYARSHTIARISDENLKRIADSGLNRIHIGMETASDKVLKLIKKGVDKETHIKAGKKVKKTGIELSEYFMPGIGGNEYSRQNALETSDAINKINPDFIRIRTLAIPNNILLYKDYEQGIFTRTNDEKMVKELLLLVKNLEGITSVIKSDHIINLLSEVEGKLPEDKEKIMNVLEWFLNLDDEEKIIFRIGRRNGIMNTMRDLENSSKRSRVKTIIKEDNITSKNIDSIVDKVNHAHS